MNLIILHAEEVDAEGRAVLRDERALHIQKVLKGKPGSTVRIGLLNGALGVGTIELAEGSCVGLSCLFEDHVPSKSGIDLILAMPRPKVMKRLWAQLAALGVGRIIILRAEKVERFYFDSHVLDKPFYEKLLIEGLQQAKCTRLPEVLIRPLFKPFVEDELDGLSPGRVKLLADPSGNKRMGDYFNEGNCFERVMLALGPEGGWSSYELDRLQEHGFGLFGMGDRVLRTDTATIALLSMLADRLQHG